MLYYICMSVRPLELHNSYDDLKLYATTKMTAVYYSQAPSYEYFTAFHSHLFFATSNSVQQRSKRKTRDNLATASWQLGHVFRSADLPQESESFNFQVWEGGILNSSADQLMTGKNPIFFQDDTSKSPMKAPAKLITLNPETQIFRIFQSQIFGLPRHSLRESIGHSPRPRNMFPIDSGGLVSQKNWPIFLTKETARWLMSSKQNISFPFQNIRET